MMTPAQLTELKSAILTTGPLVSACQPYLTTSHVAIAGLFNAVTGAGAAQIVIPSYTTAEFMTGILPAVIALGSATAAIQAKWDRLLNVTINMPTIQYAVAAGLLAQLVSDGLITQAEIDAFTTRIGSQSEVLFGAGFSLAHEDVTAALAA